MTDTVQAAAQPGRKVGFLLGVGVFLLPIVFAWFLLRQGYSTLSRVVSFGWLIFSILFVVLSPSSPSSSTSVADSSGASAAAAPVEESSNLTGPQRNAVRSAKSYLRMSGFSRDGLIQQLSADAGDGYALSDATVAVDSLDIDWNENAARSAESYLRMSGFSCSGLIHQLSAEAGDKYTVSQATYGAKKAGAC